MQSKLATPPFGIILAGGQGRRADHQDKGLIEYQGKALVDYSLAAISAVCNAVYISCNRNIETYAQRGFPTLSDITPDYPGPLHALGEALERIAHQHPQQDCLILPCDTPGISAELLQSLLNARKEYPEHWLYFHQGERDHPLHALIPASLFITIIDAKNRGEKRIMKVMFNQPHHAIPVDEQIKLNMNHWSNNTLF